MKPILRQPTLSKLSVRELVEAVRIAAGTANRPEKPKQKTPKEVIEAVRRANS